MSNVDTPAAGGDNLFRPVEVKRASEAIFEQIRDLIARGELKPGDRLPSERNMIEMFQRSRPTIREALRMLERAGYIRTVPGSNGAVVLPPNDKNLENSLADALSIGHISLDQLAEYRAASETVTAGWAAQRRTEEDLRAMERLLERMGRCLDDYEQSVSLDPDFHGLIAKAAKNTVSVIFNRTFSKLNRDYMTSRMAAMEPEKQRAMTRRVHQMHETIFAAIKAGDAEGASAAMRVHLTAFRDDLSEGSR